jgi:hypothetical protein
MDLKNYFYTIFRSLNPESYVELTDHDVGRAIKYFFFVILISSVIMFLLFIPAMWDTSSLLNEKVKNFDNLDINFSIKLGESFILLDDPLIRVSDSANSINITNEKLLVTEEGVAYRQFFFFGKETLFEWDKDVDLKETLFDSSLNRILLFLAPSLFIWGTLSAMLYYIVIILFTYILSMVIIWILGMRMSWDKTLKAAIYSSTIMIIVQMLVFPFYRLFIIPLILYWLLYVIVIILIKDETKGHGPSQVLFDRKSNKKNNVFDDDVDVDNRSNVKKSKSKRSYDEENDGYVELK